MVLMTLITSSLFCVSFLSGVYKLSKAFLLCRLDGLPPFSDVSVE
jgi:hypothetical protein